MSKKDYIKFAAMLKETLQDIDNEDSISQELKIAAKIQHSVITGRIANIFSDDNPSFDRAKFFAAVGYGK